MGVVKNAVAGLGFDQDAPMVTFPIDVFLIESDLTPVESGKQEFIDGLLDWKPVADTKGIRNAEMIDLDVDDYESAVVKTNNLFLSNLWADGLPIIPPTAEKIDWVLQGTDRPRDEQIGKFMPRGGIVTVETLSLIHISEPTRPY